MLTFKAQKAQSGNAVAFGLAASTGVEIVINTHSRRVHDEGIVLTKALMSDADVDAQVDRLISDLEMVREAAKKQLKGHK